jgi:hypothetical protein
MARLTLAPRRHSFTQVETVIENARGERDAELDEEDEDGGSGEEKKEEVKKPSSPPAEKTPERHHKVTFEETKVGADVVARGRSQLSYRHGKVLNYLTTALLFSC